MGSSRIWPGASDGRVGTWACPRHRDALHTPHFCARTSRPAWLSHHPARRDVGHSHGTVATALEAAAQDVLAACNAQCAWWLLLSPLAAAATNRPVLLLGRSVDSRGQRGSRTLRLVTEPGRRPARRAEYSRVHSRSWQQDSWPDSPETSSRKPRKSGRGALGERVDPSVADSEVTYQAALGWPQGTRESRPY